MSVLTILTPDFLESLPDDDPQSSFVMIVQRCEQHLAEQLQHVNENESSEWYVYATEQYTAMRTIISAAQRLRIEPFSEMVVPARKKFDSDTFAQFQHEVDHYLTQFLLDRAIREKRESVLVPPKMKDRLRSHIHAMRSQIDAAEISEAKRAKLHAKLTEFEQSLEKDRVAIFKLARVLIEVLSITANVDALSQSPQMHKLTASIMQQFAEAKAADDDSRKPPLLPEQKWIALPPRMAETKGPRESFSADLDDEIPF